MEKKWIAKIHLNDIAIWDFVLIVTYYFLFNFFARTEYATTMTVALTYLRYFTLILLVWAILRELVINTVTRHFIIAFLLISLLVIAGTFLFHPEIDQFSETVSTFFSTVAQLALLAYLVTDVEKLLKHLRVFSLIATLLLLYYLFIHGVTYNNGRYSMALGYVSLVPAVILFHNFFKHKNPVDLIAASIITITILSFGSRGPLLCLGLYIVLVLLKSSKPQYLIAAIIVLLIFYLFFNQIMSSLLSIVSGSSTSRTLQYILNGQMSEDSGRYLKYSKVIDELKQNPFIIRGINSDYLLIGKYTHNIFLEILYEFGCIVGGVVCIDLIYRIIISFIHSSDSIESELCFMFMCIAIPQLMISHSLWAEWTFWVWYVLYIKIYGHGLLQAVLLAIGNRK